MGRLDSKPRSKTAEFKTTATDTYIQSWFQSSSLGAERRAHAIHRTLTSLARPCCKAAFTNPRQATPGARRSSAQEAGAWKRLAQPKAPALVKP